MSSPIKIWYDCPKCEHEHEVNVWPVIPAQTYGPPESCSPEEGGEFEPTICDKCGAAFDADAVNEKASDKAESDQELYDRTDGDDPNRQRDP